MIYNPCWEAPQNAPKPLQCTSSLGTLGILATERFQWETRTHMQHFAANTKHVSRCQCWMESFLWPQLKSSSDTDIANQKLIDKTWSHTIQFTWTGKRFHLINAEIICDETMSLLNIVVQWPGETHNSPPSRSCWEWLPNWLQHF